MKNKKYVDGIRKKQPSNKKIALETLKVLLVGVGIVLLLDAMFFMGWVISGQYPADNFYFGAITKNIILAVI